MLMEADVEGVIGAGRHERSVERLKGRDGVRSRTLDTRLGAFLGRPLFREWLYLVLGATSLRRRDEGGQLVCVAATIAEACDAKGRRESLGLRLGPCEAATFWAGLLKSLVRCGAMGVEAMGEMLNLSPADETPRLPPRAARTVARSSRPAFSIMLTGVTACFVAEPRVALS